jgi:hypothetical protein
MKNIFTIISFFIVATTVAQGKYGVVKTYGFYKENFPGMIMRDLDGNEKRPPADTSFFAVMELKGLTQPTWTRAWVNGKTYEVLQSRPNGSQKVGKKNDTDQAVFVKAAKGNSLLRVDLEKTTHKSLPTAYRNKNMKDQIILEGLYRQQKIYVVVNRAMHLMPDERP